MAFFLKLKLFFSYSKWNVLSFGFGVTTGKIFIPVMEYAFEARKDTDLHCFQLTGLLENTIGVQGMFMSFGFICILFFVVAYKCVPETHGKTYRDSVLVKKYQTQWMHQGIQDKPISVAVSI